MKTKKLFLLALLCLSQKSFAAETTIIDRPEDAGVYRDSSEFHRIDKKYSVQLQGGMTSNVNSYGVILSHFLDRNTVIQLELLHGSDTTTDAWAWTYGSGGSTSSTWQSQRDLKSYGLHLKKFTGNSFYVNGGVDFRFLDYKSSLLETNSPAYQKQSSFSSQSLNASVSIGNQWQWENFTLGCDWIGISLPVASRIDQESVTANASNYDSEKRDLDRKMDEATKKAQYHALRLHVGWTF